MNRAMTALLAGAALIGVACGSGPLTVGTSTTAPSAQTGTATSSSVGGTTSSSGGGGESSTTAATFSGAGSQAYCMLSRQYDAASKSLQGGTPEDIRRTVELFRAAENDLKKVVPPELQADWNLVLPILDSFLQAVVDANYDFNKVDPAKLQALMNPQVQQALSRIEQYDQRVCGIISSTSSSSP
jgi:hypothetical protein